MSCNFVRFAKKFRQAACWLGYGQTVVDHRVVILDRCISSAA